MIISLASGAYVVFGLFVFANTPKPELVQVIFEAPPEKDPFKIATSPAQIVVSFPAETIAAGFIVIVNVSESERQGAPPGLSVVPTITTDPLLISLGPGEYIGVKLILLSKVPSPRVDQMMLEAVPENTPDRRTLSCSQIVVSLLMFTIGPFKMVNTTVSDAEGQGPAGSSVSIIKVSVPFEIANADGVYSARGSLLFGEKEPDPNHVIEDAAPPKDPFN